MRTFQYSDAKSHKFWSIDVEGKSFTVTFGKIGTAGQTQTKKFPTAEKAQAEADKLVREKTKNGYVETSPSATSREVAAFESALRANPDDLAGWSAFADYLAEQDDPRGEFMQTQIALEDESRPKKERDALKKKETALLKAHERDWLGRLAPFVFEEDQDPEADEDYTTGVEHRWGRGYVSGLVVERLSTALAQAIASDPAAQFVRELRVRHTMQAYLGEEEIPNQPRPRVKPPRGVGRYSELFELIGPPCLQTLRVFQIGQEVEREFDADEWPYHRGYDCHAYVPGLEHIVAAMPRVEELHLYCKSYNPEALFALRNLTQLRVLRVYHLGVRRGGREPRRYEYPLDVLANNPALANLTHLLFHPHHEEYHSAHYGQPRMPSFLPLDQVRALLRSKHLARLTHLQLRVSNMGDEGAREIVSSGVLRRLKVLDLRHGCVTDEGARLLAASPDVKNLEHLDLSRNGVSSAGVKVLRRAGVRVRADRPLTAQELAEEQYLFEGDSE